MAVGLQFRGEADFRPGDAVLWGGGKPHVFVAGGLTFLGRNLILVLQKAGYGVKSMASTIDKRMQLRALGCSSVGYGTEHSFEAIRAAATGCIYAVHCATAIAHFDVSGEDIVFQSNNLVTSNIIKACKALNIVKLVLQSSEAVLYDGCPLRNTDESCPSPSSPSSYCTRSLQSIEKLVLDANDSCLQTVVVRPRLLWGKGDDQFLPSVISNAKSGQLRLVRHGNYLTSTCHVSNACEGIACALRFAEGGQVFFLTDGTPVRFSEFIRDLLLASGVENVDEALSRSVPLWAAFGLGHIAETLGKTFGQAPPMTLSGIGLIGQEMTFNDARARTLISFKSETTMEQGFDEIRQHYLQIRAKADLGLQ